MLRLGIALLALAVAAPVHAEDTLSAWVDLHLAHTDGGASWREGGFGKLRYGGESSLDVARAAVVWTPRLTDTVTANLSLQCVAPACERVGVVEAYVRWKPVPRSAIRYTLRAGQFFPPFSLEHDGPGWTATRTLTPSALNTWVGEELLASGAEATVTRVGDRQRLGLTAGIFDGADTAGTILTFRGWALHDLTAGTGGRLPLPSSGATGWAQVFTRQAAQSHPLVELDGRAGSYLRLDWQPPAPLALNLFVWQNPGKPTLVRNGQYGWTTRMTGAGLRWQMRGNTEILAQALGGTTKMGGVMLDGRHPADIAYDAAYTMISQTLPDTSRLSGRVEMFEIKDRSIRTLDDNSDKGYALTVAWTKPVNAHLDLAAEAVDVHSNHPAAITQGLEARQTQVQFQLSLKFHV